MARRTRTTEKKSDDRDELIEQIRRCDISRQSRRAVYEQLRAWYERGSENSPRARQNKLRSHIDRVKSYVFAPDTARFGIHLPPSVRGEWMSAAGIARDEFRQTWHDSGADLIILSALEWALVYGATIIKLQSDPYTGFRFGYIHPADFGVSQEDVPQLDLQHAFTHHYVLSIPQIEWWLTANPELDQARLMAIAEEHKSTGHGGTTNRGLVLSSITGVFPGGTVQGGFPGEPDPGMDMISATVDEPTVEFVDLWQRKTFRKRSTQTERVDEFEDWQVNTFIADADVLFVKRRNPDLPWTRTGQNLVLPGEHPFVKLCPRPLPDYFWGRSELTDLRPLQVWLEEHIEDVRAMVKKQLKPSKFFSGVPDWEEAGRAMNTDDGGYGGSPEPGGKMDTIKVELTPAAFTLWDRINAAFAEASGIPEMLSEPGQTPGGMRSTGHFSMAAGISGGRIRSMALVVEDSLGDGATKGFHGLQRNDTQLYPREGGPPFLLAQLPPSLSFRVSAHSAAPIFAEQTQAKAQMLKKFGAITNEDLVELTDPPNREELKLHAKMLDEQKAEQAKELLDIQRAKAERGKGPGRPKGS